MTATNPDGSYWIVLRVGRPGDYLEYEVDSATITDPDPNVVQVLDGLRIGWKASTSEPWPSHPEPVEASFGLYAPDAPEVAPYVVQGAAVEISLYTADPGLGGDRWLTFAGRIVASSASHVRRKTGDVTLFSVSCLDFLVDLAEFQMDFGDRPAEMGTDRITAICDMARAAGGPDVQAMTLPLDLAAISYGVTDLMSIIKDWTRQYNGSGVVGAYYRTYARPTYTLGAMEPGYFLRSAYTSYLNDSELLPGYLAAEDNLMVNPGFDVDLTSWQATDGAAIARVTTPVSTGPGALRVTGAAGFAGATNDTGYLVPVTAGQSYTLQAKSRAAATPRAFSVSIYYYNAAIGLLSTHTSPGGVTTTTGWTQQSITATAPAGAVWALTWLRSISAVGDIQYWDDVVFTNGVPVVDLTIPGSFGSDLSEGVVDGCQIDLAATTWASRKRNSPTSVVLSAPVGVFTAKHNVTPPVKLSVTADIMATGLGDIQAQRVANMYLPPLEDSAAWEVTKFVAYAGPLIDGLGQPGGRIPDWFLDPTNLVDTEFTWPTRPVVVTNLPDPVNLSPDTGIYAGHLSSAEVAIQRRKFLVTFSLRHSLPIQTGASDIVTYDYTEAVFPTVDYDHVDPDLSYYETRLARRL